MEINRWLSSNGYQITNVKKLMGRCVNSYKGYWFYVESGVERRVLGVSSEKKTKQ